MVFFIFRCLPLSPPPFFSPSWSLLFSTSRTLIPSAAGAWEAASQNSSVRSRVVQGGSSACIESGKAKERESARGERAGEGRKKTVEGLKAAPTRFHSTKKIKRNKAKHLPFCFCLARERERETSLDPLLSGAHFASLQALGIQRSPRGT